MTDGDLMARLREAFRVESEERLRSMALRLVELEKSSGPDEMAPHLDVFYRDTHSLKGAARAIEFSSVEILSQAMEGVLSALKEGRIESGPELFDLLHRSLGMIEGEVEASDAGPRRAPDPAVGGVAAALDEVAAGGAVETALRRASPVGKKDPGGEARQESLEKTQPHPGDRGFLSESARIPLEKLESLLRSAEEMIRVKLMARRHLHSLRDVAGSMPEGAPGEDALRELVREAEGNLLTLSVMVDELIREAEDLTLLPFSVLFELLPVMVRELSRSQGTSVEMTLRGEDVQVDRRVLERIKDPLIHLIRNAIDHGFGTDDEPGGGKTEGTLVVEALQVDANHVAVTVSDDGRGIPWRALATQAVEGGLLATEEAEEMGRDQLLSVALMPGVSTHGKVTSVSGRGVGLSVVADAVRELGGTLSVESEPGEGTSFRMVLPVTLATMRGLLVQASGQSFILPTSEVRRTASYSPDEILAGVEGRAVRVEGRLVPLVSLARLLGLPAAPRGRAGPGTKGETGSEGTSVVVLDVEGDMAAVAVDLVEAQDEFLAKDLGPQLGRVRHVSGATVMGDGSVTLILNPREILETVLSGGVRERESEGRDEDAVLPARVLVVEDSFTSRVLLKDILESAGYEVVTAVDGREAFTLLKSQPFDVVVSDVQMPRMDGLELTRAIRAEEGLTELPVVLVSSLDRPRDREAGIGAGADAYVGKTSFDQANLLDVVRRYC